MKPRCGGGAGGRCVQSSTLVTGEREGSNLFCLISEGIDASLDKDGRRLLFIGIHVFEKPMEGEKEIGASQGEGGP